MIRLTLFRAFLVIALILVCAWSVITRLYENCRGLYFDLRCDFGEDTEQFRAYWRNGRFS